MIPDNGFGNLHTFDFASGIIVSSAKMEKTKQNGLSDSMIHNTISSNDNNRHKSDGHGQPQNILQ